MPSTLPDLPKGATNYDDYTSISIHPHPTDPFTISSNSCPAIRADGKLDGADNGAFQEHRTNIIVGRLGGSTGN